MKKIFLILSLSLLLFACDSKETSNEKMGKGVEPYGNIPAENVNGNIPDTNNAINLNPTVADSANLPLDTPVLK